MSYIEDDLPLIGNTPPEPYEKKKDSLTFGIEIEFAVAAIRKGKKDPCPDGRTVVGLFDGPHDPTVTGWIYNAIRHIGIALQDAGIPVERTEPKKAPRSQKAWGITTDISVCAPENELYEWAPIEINSPAYFYSETNAERALEEIKIVCETLTSHFRISCNWSSGLHVHVGNGNNGFLVETIRNLMATIWTFEPQIEEIHPPHRRQNPWYCPGYREGTVLGFQEHLREKRNTWNKSGKQLPEDIRQERLEDMQALSMHKISLLDGDRSTLEPDVSHGLGRLMQATSVDEIIYLSRTHDRTTSANGGFKMAYHLGNVEFRVDGDDSGADEKRTIEFRQHKSTLDFDEISNWIRFCVLLVHFADVVDRERLDPYLQLHIKDFPEDYPLGKVLEKLGMPWLAHYYPTKIAEERMNQAPVSQLQETYNIMQMLWDTYDAEQGREE